MLLEILVVIAIPGPLIGLVAPAALRQLGGARVSVARQSVERLGARTTVPLWLPRLSRTTISQGFRVGTISWFT
jgi:hypothetical protein